MERVEELMTAHKYCSSANDGILKISQQMTDKNCSEIIVVNDEKRPVGIITEHDITIECSKGINPLKLKAVDCMKKVPVVIPHGMYIEDCLLLLEQKNLKIAPVVDDNGAFCGMIELSDMVKLFND